MFTDLKPEVQEQLASEAGYFSPGEIIEERNWELFPIADMVLLYKSDFEPSPKEEIDDEMITYEYKKSDDEPLPKDD
ncbi:MAG: hypothetical protein ACR2IE_20180 [Candidatus Sumerlaeaceae bacterium]